MANSEDMQAVNRLAAIQVSMAVVRVERETDQPT